MNECLQTASGFCATLSRCYELRAVLASRGVEAKPGVTAACASGAPSDDADEADASELALWGPRSGTGEEKEGAAPAFDGVRSADQLAHGEPNASEQVGLLHGCCMSVICSLCVPFPSLSRTLCCFRRQTLVFCVRCGRHLSNGHSSLWLNHLQLLPSGCATMCPSS